MEKDATRTMIDKIYESSQNWIIEQNLKIDVSSQDWIDERIAEIDAQALAGTLPKVKKAPPRKMTKAEKGHHRLRTAAKKAPADERFDLVFNYMAIEEAYSLTPDGISLTRNDVKKMFGKEFHHLNPYPRGQQILDNAFMLEDINAKRAELRGARNH